MYLRLSAFAPVILVALGAAACDDGSTALRTRPTRSSAFESRLVSVEPARIAPEFLAHGSCAALRPFQTRFNLFVHTERDLFLRQLRFEFRDRSGGRAVPLAIPASLPVSLPRSHPLPIPGTLPFHGTVMSPPFGTVGLILNFDCGVRAEGTLVIDIETADRDGRSTLSQVLVPVG